jgi:hypothetical protein
MRFLVWSESYRTSAVPGASYGITSPVATRQTDDAAGREGSSFVSPHGIERTILRSVATVSVNGSHPCRST